MAMVEQKKKLVDTSMLDQLNTQLAGFKLGEKIAASESSAPGMSTLQSDKGPIQYTPGSQSDETMLKMMNIPVPEVKREPAGYRKTTTTKTTTKELPPEVAKEQATAKEDIKGAISSIEEDTYDEAAVNLARQKYLEAKQEAMEAPNKSQDIKDMASALMKKLDSLGAPDQGQSGTELAVKFFLPLVGGALLGGSAGESAMSSGYKEFRRQGETESKQEAEKRKYNQLMSAEAMKGLAEMRKGEAEFSKSTNDFNRLMHDTDKEITKLMIDAQKAKGTALEKTLNARIKDAQDFKAQMKSVQKGESTAVGDISGGQPTQAEREAAGRLGRAQKASLELDALSGPTGMGHPALRDKLYQLKLEQLSQEGITSTIVNAAVKDPEIRRAIQAEIDWGMNFLRTETGAAIAKHEMGKELNKYFPRSGDSQETINQKKSSRKQVERALESEAGRAQRVQVEKPQVAPKKREVGRDYSPKRNKTRIRYNDGTTEMVDGKQTK